jgi:hypothetical protein
MALTCVNGVLSEVDPSLRLVGAMRHLTGGRWSNNRLRFVRTPTTHPWRIVLTLYRFAG